MQDKVLFPKSESNIPFQILLCLIQNPLAIKMICGHRLRMQHNGAHFLSQALHLVFQLTVLLLQIATRTQIMTQLCISKNFLNLLYLLISILKGKCYQRPHIVRITHLPLSFL